MVSHPEGVSLERWPLDSERATFSALLESVRAEVDDRIAAIWERELGRRSAEGRTVCESLMAASDLCRRGGKRLRAGLVAAAYCAATGNENWRPVSAVCTAIELLQSYFLIHDDWMDDDEVRRGGPAVHARLRQVFGSTHLGAAGGVLAGDYTLALAQRELVEAELESQTVVRLLAVLAEMQLDAVAGQQLDVLDPEPDFERVYQLKTGSYTVAGPLKLGVVAAGAGADWESFVEQFGLPLGVAFQLQDDLIGAFAPDATSGKPQGSDLSAGKKTLLLQLALQNGSAAQKSAIDAVFGKPQPGEPLLAAAIEALEASGARAGVEARIGGLVAEARQRLGDDCPLAPAGRRLFAGIADALTRRVR